jgi:hypothetical protein
MNTRRVFRFWVPLAVLVVCAIGISRAEDELYSEEATTGYGLLTEVIIRIANVNGVHKETVDTNGAEVVTYQRTIASTIPWSVVSDSDETYSYYRAIPGRAETESQSTCCSFDCHQGLFDIVSGHCLPNPTGSCQVCNEVCNSINGTCGARAGKWLEIIHP